MQYKMITKYLPDIMHSIHVEGIIDSTLREGIQAPGISFDFEQKIKIIHSLLAVGIDEIELGVAAASFHDLPNLIKEARTIAGRRCKLSLWCRCKPEDIDFAARCGPDILSLSIPVSDLHVSCRLGRSREWVLDTIVRAVAYAKRAGFRQIALGFEDATRADREFLARSAAAASSAGASRVRLADTVGIATPGMISSMIGQVRRHCSLPLGIHAHNDFGMATANTIAALEAGASWADATILGLGERSGSCRLEELVGYLSLIACDSRYTPGRLPELCTLVAAAAGLKISGRHPVVGEEIFTCETGLHVHGLTAKPETYEPFDPQRIGKSRILRFGAKTGTKAIQQCLASMGIRLSDHQAAELVTRVRKGAGEGRESLNIGELLSFARKEGFG